MARESGALEGKKEPAPGNLRDNGKTEDGTMSYLQEVQKISEAHYVLPKIGDMRVDVHAYWKRKESQKLLTECIRWRTSRAPTEVPFFSEGRVCSPARYGCSVSGSATPDRRRIRPSSFRYRWETQTGRSLERRPTTSVGLRSCAACKIGRHQGRKSGGLRTANVSNRRSCGRPPAQGAAR